MASGSASQIQAGGAYVTIGVRDETRAALEAVKKAISASMKEAGHAAGQGLAPANSGLGTFSSKGSKAALVATQLTYAVDDAASQLGTSGFAGALRAAGNNLTQAAALMGGLRTQILATTLLVGVQLSQAWLKAAQGGEKYAETLERIKGRFDSAHKALEMDFEQRQLPQRLAELKTPEAAQARMNELLKESARLREVEQRALEVEKNTLESMLANVKQGAEAQNWVDDASQFYLRWTIGYENAADKVKFLQEALAKVALEQGQLDKRATGLDAEREATARRFFELQLESAAEKDTKARADERQQRIDNGLDVLGQLREALTGLAGDDDEQRIESQREAANEALDKLGIGAAVNHPALDAGGKLADQIAHLQREQLRLSELAVADPARLPSALAEGSAAAARQARENRLQGNNPELEKLTEIGLTAGELRDKLDELLRQVSSF